MATQGPSPALFFDTISAYQRTEALRAAINEDGLESAKPDLQSTFKKPDGDTAEPRLWGMLRDGRAREGSDEGRRAVERP